MRSTAVALAIAAPTCLEALSLEVPKSRRDALQWIGGVVTGGGLLPAAAHAVAEMPDRFDVEDYLRTGLVSQPMGVSGQAGKSKPETGVFLRDGSEVFRDSRNGNVLAEILVKSGSGPVPVLASYSSPWPLATGTVFDVECRDPETGDGVFLAVSSDVQGQSVKDLKDSFFINNLFAPTGRFSFYGQPTDVKVKKTPVAEGSSASSSSSNYRMFDVTFSTLSQSTQAEIPRRARVIATIPEGTNQAVMLVASASALRWKKGSEKKIASVVESFRATPAPQTSLKVRAKERRG